MEKGNVVDGADAHVGSAAKGDGRRIGQLKGLSDEVAAKDKVVNVALLRVADADATRGRQRDGHDSLGGVAVGGGGGGDARHEEGVEELALLGRRRRPKEGLRGALEASQVAALGEAEELLLAPALHLEGRHGVRRLTIGGARDHDEARHRAGLPLAAAAILGALPVSARLDGDRDVHRGGAHVRHKADKAHIADGVKVLDKLDAVHGRRHDRDGGLRVAVRVGNGGGERVKVLQQLADAQAAVGARILLGKARVAGKGQDELAKGVRHCLFATRRGRERPEAARDGIRVEAGGAANLDDPLQGASLCRRLPCATV